MPQLNLFFRLSKFSALFLSLILLALFLYLDFVTGKEINVSILYFIPVILLSWNVDAKTAIVFSLISAILKVYVDKLTGLNFSHYLIFFWEGFIQFLIFSAFAIMAAKLKSSLQRLEEKNEQLEKANELKNELLGIASHDLKNPLSNIYSIASIIEEDQDLSKIEVKEMITKITSIARNMFKLIEDLLSLSAIEMDNLTVKPEPVNLNSVFSQILEQYQSSADKKSIKIHFQTENKIIIAFVDLDLTIQIFDNLISNALKFSLPDKNIWIRIKELNNDTQKILIEIQDEGPGFTEEDKLKLFKRFSKLSAKPTGGEYSTGLGLFTVKKFVEAMHGNVWCESKKNKGATFFIQLPKSNAQHTEE